MTLDETEFHRFAVLWDETGYTFYVDGVEDGRIDAIGDTFLVDYVRVFDIVK